ncbi:MAG: dihydroorotase [Chloroflexi bacterium]|nr:dihydroorotase [Chloroflexota bacterium]
MKAEPLLIRGGRTIDPSSKLDDIGDILLQGGKVVGVGSGITAPEYSTVIEAAGLVICPGFIDLHCHLREPGYEHKETVASGTRAAAKGGFTTVCCMPNTNPPLDSAATIEYVLAKSRAEGLVRVLPVGCITKGRQGKELAEMAEMARAGAVAFSDDGEPVLDSRIMRHALEYSLSFGLPLVDHCEDKALSAGGVMNEGWVSNRLGLGGIPAAAEENMVARDISLAQQTGARIHIAHVSTAGSVELIRRAKEKGVRITAEVTPHHLTLAEDRVMGREFVAAGYSCGARGLPSDSYDTDAKVNPPLRTAADIEALVEAVGDGTIDAIATDHAPHAWEDKVCEFGLAAVGISGLETALGALMGLVSRGDLELNTLVSKLTAGPSGLLGSRAKGLGSLVEGFAADIVIFDPEAEWVVQEQDIVSKGKNTPFKGATLRGKVMATIFEGGLVYRADGLKVRGAK